MNNIFEYLKDKYPYWGWMGQRAHDASAINQVISLDFILCCDHGVEVPLYFDEAKLFSLERIHGIRKDWSNEHLKVSLEGSLGREFFGRINSRKGVSNIICYRSIKTLEQKSDAGKYRILASEEAKKRYFDNKIRFHSKLPELGLQRIPGKTGVVGAQNFNSLTAELLLPFVVRFPYGSSGQFTFIVHEEKDYNVIIEKYLGHPAIFEKFIKGFSLNVNAVIVDTPEGEKTVCSFPSVQLTGMPQCCNYSSSFCGNDFSSACSLDKKTIDEVIRITQIIGGWMGSYGFRGVFGMDLMVSEEKVYPLEINPRFQNSTALFDTLKVISGQDKNMLFLLHVLQFLQGEDVAIQAFLKKYPYEEFMTPLQGAQVILHNKVGKNKIKRSVLPGVYNYDGTNFSYQRPEALLSEKVKTDEILLTCAVPGKGVVIEDNSPLCKIQCLKKVVGDYDNIHLNEDISQIIGTIYDGFIFEKINEAEAVTT